jgi:LAS superfamily LD-carboxypeptidase LdcB
LTFDTRTRAARIRWVAVVSVAGALAGPVALGLISGASANPQRDEREAQTPGTQGDEVERPGELPIEVDVYRADQSAVSDTLDSLTGNVTDQLADLGRARADLRAAEQGVDRAQAAVDETEQRIDRLVARSDEVAVQAFVNPPAEVGLDALAADSLAEATIKQSILDQEASASAEVLEDLATAREEVEVQRATREDAVGEAENRATDAETELADLEAAQSQQALFVAQVQDRLDQRLAEADALEGLAPEMADRIRRREAQLASQIEEIRNAEAMQQALAELALAQAQAEAEARAEAERLAAEAAAAAPGDIGAPSGSLTDVACPGGGSITVDSALGRNLEMMLEAASAAGLTMCGGGYRSPDEQIQLRIAHCGSSYYAIYEMPASSCSPPTARPGSSNHEQGLAVDFTCDGSLIESSASPCFEWLTAHAADYGFYNLPAERWHWSNDGT